MSDKTELPRRILIEAYDNRQLNQREIADRVDCSASYVSTVLNRYDGHDAMEARIEELNSQLGVETATAGIGRERQPSREKQPQIDWDEVARALENGVQGFRVLLAKVKGNETVANELSTGKAVAYLVQGAVAVAIVGLVLYVLARVALVLV